MNYVMSDIHGYYREYREMLKKIRLKDSDNLYILGDVVDKGPYPVKVLQDMMLRVNVFPLLGNHDYFAMRFLLALQNGMDKLTEDERQNMTEWIKGDGAVTASQIMKLDEEEREDLLDYLEEFLLTAQIKAGGKKFVFVHAGLDNFSPERELDDYHFSELIYHEPNYDRVYFKDKYLITGHRPTFKLDESSRGRILEKNNHIAIDCGAGYGICLGAYCLETGEKFYVDINKK